MKNKLLNDEKMIKIIARKIASLIRDIDPKSVEKQLKEFDEDTTDEIIYKLVYTEFESNQSCDLFNLVNFLKDIFEHPTVHISDFYKQLSEKFNGKYSPEELKFICENEKQLICSLLKENDIVETKSNVYVKRYDKGCNPIGVSVSPHVDIVKIIKQLSETSEIKKSE